jgi:lambda repressor-like predicted transcriptional regulator
VVFHEACLYAFLTEGCAPPVVVSAHVWQLRREVRDKGWSGEMVGAALDRVMLKQFWNAAEVEELYTADTWSRRWNEENAKSKVRMTCRLSA